MAYFDKRSQRWIDDSGFYTNGYGFGTGARTVQTAPGNTGARGSISTVVPASPASYAPAYGGIPQVPDPAAAAKAAAEANLANLGLYNKIASGLNAAQYAELMGQIRAGNPLYDENRLQASANANYALQGVVNPDVQRNLARAAAERGISRGGVLTDADYLYGLGLTSHGEQARGADLYSQLIASTPRTSLADASKSFISPDDVYNANLYANLLASAAVPSARAAEDMGALTRGVGTGMGQTAPGFSGGVNPNIADILARYSKGQTAPQPMPVAPVAQPVAAPSVTNAMGGWNLIDSYLPSWLGGTGGGELDLMGSQGVNPMLDQWSAAQDAFPEWYSSYGPDEVAPNDWLNTDSGPSLFDEATSYDEFWNENGW